jgi:DNA-binding NarL/FixJ family response regulator
MKVLIIDDDKFVSTLLESELRQDNNEVRSFSDGEHGLAEALDWKPDVIVLDLIIPKKDGFEVLQALHLSREKQHPAVFIFSSLSQPHDMEEAIALGARGYFMKGEHTVHHIVEAIRELSQSTHPTNS